MTIKKKGQRLLALLLAVATIFSAFSISAQAATIADGSKSVTIAKKERHTYLKTTSGTAIGGSGYNYKTNDGITGVAYCINWGLALTGKSLEITGRYTASPKTMGAFANGFPQRSVADFLELYGEKYPNLTGFTEDEFLYATQLAIWATLGQLGIEGTAFTAGRVTIANPTNGTEQQKRVYTAITIILALASTWSKPLYTGMYVSSREDILDHAVELPYDMTLQNTALRSPPSAARNTLCGSTASPLPHRHGQTTTISMCGQKMHHRERFLWTRITNLWFAALTRERALI